MVSIFESLSTLHSNLLKALKENQPLIVLTSLSLLIASLSQIISQDISGFAIAATICFFFSFISSLLHSLKKVNLYILAMFYTGFILGFCFLALIIWSLINSNLAGTLAYYLIIYFSLALAFGIFTLTSASYYKSLKDAERKFSKLKMNLTLVLVSIMVICYILNTIINAFFIYYNIQLGSSPFLVRSISLFTLNGMAFCLIVLGITLKMK